MTKFALVGDVGDQRPPALCDLASGEISCKDLFRARLPQSGGSGARLPRGAPVTVNEGCIAIACPITGDWVAMTNHTGFLYRRNEAQPRLCPSGDN